MEASGAMSMAAKKKSQDEKSNSRREPYTPSRLLKVAKKLSDRATKFRAAAKALQLSLAETGADSVEIDGHRMLIRAFEQIDSFLANSNRSITATMQQEEDL